LAKELGLALRFVGTGKRMTFSTGDARLSAWMEKNAKVVWQVCHEPWKLEEELISILDLPLNLDQNERHGFHPELSRMRGLEGESERASDPSIIGTTPECRHSPPVQRTDFTQ
jgi:hypothetical protein